MSNETKLYLMIVGTFALAIGSVIKGATNEILIKQLTKKIES